MHGSAACRSYSLFLSIPDFPLSLNFSRFPLAMFPLTLPSPSDSHSHSVLLKNILQQIENNERKNAQKYFKNPFETLPISALAFHSPL